MKTVRELKALKPREKDYLETLGGGLSVRIYPTGKKVFIYRYTFEGSVKKYVIGKYPEITLANARELKVEAAQKVKQGFDLNLEQKANIAKRIAEPTVQEAFEIHKKKYLEKQIKDPQETIRKFTKDVLPFIGSMKIKTVEKSHLIAILDQITERNSPIQAKRTLSALKVFFRLCEERGLIKYDPALGIRKGSIGGKEKPKDRHFSKSEIKIFWEKLDDAPFSIQVKLVLKILLLTGQRIGEACNAEWQEIDFSEKIWSIPAIKTKTGQKHKVPLSSWTIEIFKSLKELSGNSSYVVASPQESITDKPITNRAVDRALKRHQDYFGFQESFTPHDLRRTLATHLNELEIPPHVVEKILNHKMQGIIAVYNKAEYWKERVQALESWAEWNKQILAGEKVISINRKSS